MERTTFSEFPNGEKAIVEQIQASEKRKEIQSSKTVRVKVSDPRRKVNHLIKVISDGKIITEFTRPIGSTRIG